MSSSYIKSFFRLGVRQKVMLVLLTVVLFALTTSAWLTFREAEQDNFKAVHQRGEDISRFVATSLSYSVVGYDYHTIQLLLDEIVTFEEINYAHVINTRGNTMGSSGKSNHREDEVVFAQDIKLSEKTIGYLEIGFSTFNTVNGLRKQKFTLLQREAILILLIAIGEFIALSTIIIRPVGIISKTLDDAVDDSGKVVKKIELGSRDEFGQLATMFNNLGEQLNSANTVLQSKIELADQKLIESNEKLKEQAEELKMVSAKFQEMSITDALTKLFNRRYFEELLASEIKIMRRYGDVNSVMLIDIDYFKRINDEYGHPCGDEVLQKTAALFLESVRVGDVVCRVGGEEFAVFCRRITKDKAVELANKIRLNICENLIETMSEKLNVTVSIGVSTFDPEKVESGPMYLYRQADVAVYHSKEKGRNRVSHYDDIKG